MAIELLDVGTAIIDERVVKLDRDVFEPVACGIGPDSEGIDPRKLEDQFFTFPSDEVDHKLFAYNQLSKLVALAGWAAHALAVSYRGFNVGAAAYVSSSDETKGALLIGANDTPHQGARKRCSEMHISEKAREHSLDRVVALAVYGPPDDGQVNGIQTKTLHPCPPCREMMIEDPLFTDDSLLVTTNPGGLLQLMHVPDLLAYHGHPSTGSPDGNGIVEVGPF